MDAAGLREKLRVHIGQRDDLGPRIAALRSGSLPDDLEAFSPTAQNDDFPDHAPEGRPARDVLKVERNALAAYFLPEAWQYVRGAREGFVPPAVSNPADIPGTYYREVHKFTGRLLDEWSDTREERLLEPRAGWNGEDRAYDRFVRVLSESTKAGRVRTDAAAPSEFMKVGVGSGSQVNWSLLQLVPELAARERVGLDPDAMADVARRSYGRLILQPSSTNIDVGPVMLSRLEKKDGVRFGFDTDYFDLRKDTGDGYAVEFSDTALAGPLGKSFDAILTRPPSSDTTWCPARYSKLTPSPDGARTDITRDYFDWNLDLARRHYFPRIAGER